VARVSRAFWFAAGIASGVYGVFKVKRTIENFTPDGIGARVAAVRRGARVFADEVSTAARERERELLADLRAGAPGDRLLPAAEPAVPAPRHAAPIESADRHRRNDSTHSNHSNHSEESEESVTDGHR
jgi:hypothetical protein